MSPRLSYLTSSFLGLLQSRRRYCPSCGTQSSNVIDRKYIVTALRRCSKCQLLFRTPTRTAVEDSEFYQRQYRNGITTEMPNSSDLATMVASGFEGSEKDYSAYVRLLDDLGCKRGARLLDFGASWGYGTWQFQRAGFQTIGYEISRNRAQFGRSELKCDIKMTLDEVGTGYDIFFSSHVLEHVPNVAETLRFAFGSVKQGGLVVLITPNGSESRRSNDWKGWHSSWGLVHPNLLDNVYYQHNFRANPYLVTSYPVKEAEVRAWAEKRDSQFGADCSGGDLLFVGVKA